MYLGPNGKVRWRILNSSHASNPCTGNRWREEGREGVREGEKDEDGKFQNLITINIRLRGTPRDAAAAGNYTSQHYLGAGEGGLIGGGWPFQ